MVRLIGVAASGAHAESIGRRARQRPTTSGPHRFENGHNQSEVAWKERRDASEPFASIMRHYIALHTDRSAFTLNFERLERETRFELATFSLEG
jgi:hypothetical protein